MYVAYVAVLSQSWHSCKVEHDFECCPLLLPLDFGRKGVELEEVQTSSKESSHHVDRRKTTDSEMRPVSQSSRNWTEDSQASGRSLRLDWNVSGSTSDPWPASI